MLPDFAKDICLLAKKRGVSFDVFERAENEWYFGSFWREGNAYSKDVYSGIKTTDIPAKNLGKKYLKMLCTLADEYRCDIALYTYNDRLVEYYKSVGFYVEQVVNPRNRRMRRKPKSVLATDAVTP